MNKPIVNLFTISVEHGDRLPQLAAAMAEAIGLTDDVDLPAGTFEVMISVSPVKKSAN